MLNLDRAAVETLLSRLEEEGYPFAQYQLYKANNRLQLLGKGGFSAVYEMVDRESPNDHYAMKVIGLERHTITSDAFRDTTILQRNLSSQSSGILRIIDVREIYVSLHEDGEPAGIYEKEEESQSREALPLQFILMEKLECILVKDKFKNVALQNDVLQEEAEVIMFAMQIGRAILIAHKNNVLHRDIKLENIFWDEKEKSYKLGDFGIAKYVEEGNAETIVYTDGYGAPEIERRLSESYNATADIYSFGISLYLLLNDLKFPGSGGYYVNPVQYDSKFIFPAPRKASEELTRVIRKMCSYRREERYQSMEEVLAELQYIGEKAGILTDEDYDVPADFATETYREENGNGSGNEGAADTEESVNASRAQRKQRQKRMDEDCNRANGRYMLLFSALFVLLLEGMQTDVSFVTKWQFWVLPIAVFVTAIMQQIKDFHVVSGIATLLFGIYSVYTTGFRVPHVILLLCMLPAVPALTAAGAAGTGVWLFLLLTGKRQLLGFFDSHDLSWLIIICILLLMNRLMQLRHMWNKMGYAGAYVWAVVYDAIPLLMMVSGVLLSVLRHFKVCEIPITISKIHLIRTGFLLLLTNACRLLWQGEAAKEAAKEPMEEPAKEPEK